MHGYGDWGPFSGWVFFGMHALWWLFWVGLAVAVLASILRGSRSDGPSPPAPRTPLERLQQRYAAGEVSTEEYEERKRILERDAER